MRFIDSSDLAAGLAGLAGLAGWLVERMMRKGGSKDFPHARRSGEVGGFTQRLPFACWPSLGRRIFGFGVLGR